MAGGVMGHVGHVGCYGIAGGGGWGGGWCCVREVVVGSVCPECGRYDDSVYVRFGGVPVCRACFVTEVLLGSWLGLEPDLSSRSSSVGSSSGRVRLHPFVAVRG